MTASLMLPDVGQDVPFAVIGRVTHALVTQ